MSSSVTVSITRHVDPEQTDRMVAWINAGASLAERFEGFLGTGWERPSMDSPEWHMLYRFDSDTALDRWEDSDQRRWWLQSAQGIVGASVVERRTGIEGWFDEPAPWPPRRNHSTRGRGAVGREPGRAHRWRSAPPLRAVWMNRL